MNYKFFCILLFLISTNGYRAAYRQSCEKFFPSGKTLEDVIIETINLSHEEVRKLDRATLIHESLIYTILSNNNYCVVEFLLNEHIARNLDINLENDLYIFPLAAALSHYDIRVLKLLLDHPNIDINKQDSLTGSTALMGAIYDNNQEALLELLQTPNINVNIQNNFGKTALMYATMDGYIDAVKELLKVSDVDISLKDSSEKTVLNLARDASKRMRTKLAALTELNIEIIISSRFPSLGNMAVLGRDELLREDKEMLVVTEEILESLLDDYDIIVELLQKFQLAELFKK